MWPWVRRSRDWVMRNLWPFSRPAAQPLALSYSYERAGHIVFGQPIPWTAESVLVEALLRLPPGTGRRRSDFCAMLPGLAPIPADQIRPEGEDCYLIRFRLAPEWIAGRSGSTTAEVHFRHRPLGRLELPLIGREEFLRHLRLEMPTVSVRLGTRSVACATFVCSQGEGLVASGLLVSPTGLMPLLDLDPQVEFRCERTGNSFRLPASLSSSQLAGTSALVTVVPRKHPRRIGTWTVTWLVGEHVLACQRIRAISRKQFARSLRITDTRFLCQGEAGDFRLVRQAPAMTAGVRVGPCFYLASSEPGMAGRCQLQVSAVVPDAVRPPLLFEQEVLVTDGPVLVAPGTLDAADLAQISAFELCVAGHPLGSLPLDAVPTASFTSEGGFRAPADFTWTSAAEEEMTERLNRLLEGQPPGD